MLRFALFSLLMVSHSLFARELVIISDMDETTRMANVEKKLKAGVKLLDGVKPYEGLRMIFNEIKSTSTEAKFYYLSNSYPFLYQGKKWNRENGFPEGVIMQRRLSDKSKIFKAKKLKEIAAAHPDASFLLFGDNVEHDPDFYRDFLKNNPQIEAKVFIRDARLLFPEDETIVYFQTESQIADDLSLSKETTLALRTLPLSKSVPNFLLKNLKKNLIKECKNSVESCQDVANDRVQEVMDILRPELSV